MIVEPDFLTHWKTRMLVAELQDRAAPLYVLALWSFCQQRKTQTIPNGNPNIISSICGFEGDGKKLTAALLNSGFIDKDDENGYVAHDFMEVNSKLFSNWKNGKSGGRPKKPNHNPTETQTKPKRNPQGTDKNRVDKNRVDKKKEELSASADAVGKSGFYLTKKGRKLSGTQLEAFNRFWSSFSLPKGKAEAADAWMDIPGLTESLAETICTAATREASERPKLIALGKNPKWAQGWLTGKRWEDEDPTFQPRSPSSPSGQPLNWRQKLQTVLDTQYSHLPAERLAQYRAETDWRKLPTSIADDIKKIK
jgi:hypothetical protein